MGNLSIRQCDITTLPVDCIVNAANSQLQHGGGVCGAIFAAAGANQLQDACNEYSGCPTGEAVITPGFRLPAKYIVHAVGPRWIDGNHGEPSQLYNCYQAALTLAMQHECHSIAFPLISSGIYGYPKKEAWNIAIASIKEFLDAYIDYPMDVTIAVLDDASLHLGTECMETQRKNDFVFFWHEYDSYGVFSQWFKCSFVVEGIWYKTAEQYMMAKKALLAGDLQRYALIMNEPDPAKCKQLGKQVRNLEVGAWDRCKEEVVYHANLAKFSQNEKPLQYLLSTGNKTLAEASPYDTIWGIGMEASDPNSVHPDKWKGKNLLGKVLMRVRNELRGSNQWGV